MWKLNVVMNNLELRSCDENLLNKKEHTTLEIVRWFDKERTSCYVIAYFVVKPEDWVADLKFVDGRPFEKDVDQDDFWQLARLGFKVLKAKFEREDNE